MAANLLSPPLTSVNAATVAPAAVAAESDAPVEKVEIAEKMMEGTVAKALMPELMWSGASALFISTRIC